MESQKQDAPTTPDPAKTPDQVVPAETPAPAKVDGRKVNTPEKLARLAEGRKKSIETRTKGKQKVDVSAPADPEKIAVADVWFRNHQLMKENSRKKKMEELNAFMDTKLARFEEKIMGELQKPVADFFNSYLNEQYEEEEEPPPEKQHVVKKSKKEKESGGGGDKRATKPAADWSRFF